MSNLIDEKTKIPLAWAIAVLVSIAGMIGEGCVGYYRVGQLEEKVKEIEVDAKAKVAEDQTRDVRFQKFEDDLSSIKDSVGRIDDNVHELARAKARETRERDHH